MVLLGVANFAAAIYLFRRLPADFLVFALRTLWRIFLRLEVVGIDALPPAGSRNIVAINHISLLDAPDHPVAAGRPTAAGRRRGAGAALVDPPVLETVRRAPARPGQTDCGARAGDQGA